MITSLKEKIMNENNIANYEEKSIVVNNPNDISRLNNLDKSKYRTRATMLYDELKAIKPIDNTINNVIYLPKNIEQSLALNTNINTLKQIWTEYRLFYNEKNSNKANQETQATNINDTQESYILSNFDEIFQELNQKVDGVNGIIQELNNMKQKIHSSNLILGANQKSFELYMQQERAKLEKEKEEFELLKNAQSKKLEEEHRKIATYYQRIQQLVAKMNSQIDKLY